MIMIMRVLMMLFFCTNIHIISGTNGSTLPTTTMKFLSSVSLVNVSVYTTVPLQGPSNVTGLHCEYSLWSRTLVLVWDALNVVQPKYEVRVNKESPTIINETRYQIDDVPSVEYYDITVTSLYGGRRSSPVSIRCKSKLKGVIVAAVAVVSILFLISLLVCCEVFIKFSSVKRSSREPVVHTTTNQLMDVIYVNTCAVNVPEHQSSQLNVTDMKEENHQYEALDANAHANAPYEVCHPYQSFNRPAVTSDMDIYENI